MDWEEFESDVWDSVNESLYAFQWGSLDATDPEGFTGTVVTIGETWLGTFYGTTENTLGQRMVYMFDTRADQGDWYVSNTDDDSLLYEDEYIRSI